MKRPSNKSPKARSSVTEMGEFQEQYAELDSKLSEIEKSSRREERTISCAPFFRGKVTGKSDLRWRNSQFREGNGETLKVNDRRSSIKR